MEDSLIENDDRYLEHDSLSSDSFSKDSLLNGHHTEDLQITSSVKKRRGSYTLETSPDMSISIRNQQLTQPIYIETNDSRRLSLVTRNALGSNRPHKTDMTQSLYERPWVTSGKNNSMAKAHAKQREEKLRLAKEEQEKKLKQKMAVLSESEKIAQNARTRKEVESLRKLEEMKRKAIVRQKIVEERRERLIKAEEERRKIILRKLVNVSGKKPSPQSSNNMMTMSCYGGFGSARTRPGNKEVVQNRFLGKRPLSSTGKVIGFGSSTPRPICENLMKLNSENKKIPEAILLKCDILSRPISSRMSDRMMSSVICSPPITNAISKTPQRQSSWKEKDVSKVSSRSSVMTGSMIDYSTITKSKPHTLNKTTLKSDLTIKGQMGHSISQSNKHGDTINRDSLDAKPTLASSNSTKQSDDNQGNKVQGPSKSGSVTRRVKKTKVDTHLDSDSIEEESNYPQKLANKNDAVAVHPNEQIMETSQANAGRAPPTKDLSESEYKGRLMENRRLVREKREKEREQLMKSEREKRHAEEIVSREILEMEREKNNCIEDSHFTTSNDDAQDGPIECGEYNCDRINDEEAQLSEIAETPSVSCNDPPQTFNKSEEEKNERKKKLDSIMSRIRRPNEESSSDGGVSPRRAMSPEQAELEPEVNNNITSVPAFKSSLLQSMMNKGGRLTKGSPSNKDPSEGAMIEDDNLINIAPTTLLSSVRESIEDSESLLTNINSPSSAAIRSSGIEGNSLSDANSEFAPEQVLETYEEEVPDKDSTLSYVTPSIDREDCDGKEDSLSINEPRNIANSRMTIGASPLNDAIERTSLSSTETEEEEIVKTSFEIESLYGSTILKSVSQETCVFQN